MRILFVRCMTAHVVCLFIAAALMIAGVSSSAAQSDPFDLAQAGFVAKDRGDFALAIRLFNEALVRGRFEGRQKGLLLYSRGASYEVLGVPNRALSDLDAAVALLPDFANVYIYRGIVWGQMREYERALQDFLTASKLNPNDPAILNNVGNAYQRLGDHDRAIESLGQAIRLRPDYAEAYYNRARSHAAKEDWQHAIADYSQTIALQPNFQEAYINRSVVYLTQGDTARALSDLNTAIKLKPTDVVALRNRANAFVMMEKYSDALRDFDTALALDPGNVAIYLGRGLARLYSGAVDDSIGDFTAAVRLRPSNPYPVIWLHTARIHKGESDHAELLENAKNVKRDAWPGTLLDLYLGTIDADSVKAAAQNGPLPETAKRDCEAKFFLGDHALHRGDTIQARDALREVISRCGPQEVGHSAAVAETRLFPTP